MSSQKIKHFCKVFTEYHETLMCMSQTLSKANTEPFKSATIFLAKLLPTGYYSEIFFLSLPSTPQINPLYIPFIGLWINAATIAVNCFHESEKT